MPEAIQMATNKQTIIKERIKVEVAVSSCNCEGVQRELEQQLKITRHRLYARVR
jgi:hypothetical protein